MKVVLRHADQFTEKGWAETIVLLIHLNASRHGGVETHTVQLALCLVEAGFNVGVVSLKRNSLPGTVLRLLADSGVAVVPPSCVGKVDSPLRLVVSAMRIRLQFRNVESIVLQGHGASGLLLRLLFPRCILVWHEYWLGLPTQGDEYSLYRPPAPRRFRFAMRSLLLSCNEVVVGANVARRNLEDVQGYRRPIQVIPPLTRPLAYHLEKVTLLASRADKEPFKFIMVGRHGRGKGTLALMEAWRRAAETHGCECELHLYGPIEDPGVRGQVEDALSDILWHGEFEVDALPRILTSASAGIMASLQEGYGLVAVEYMSAGLPIIVTDTGGAEEFQALAPDVIIAERSVEGIAIAITTMVRHLRSGQSDPQGQRAAYEAHFAPSVIGDRHISYFMRHVGLPDVSATREVRRL